jgi:hypothetical protein
MYLYICIYPCTCTYIYVCIFVKKYVTIRAERVMECIYICVFCVHYLCLIGRVYIFYVGHVDKSSLYETLFHCNILRKYHHHHVCTY